MGSPVSEGVAALQAMAAGKQQHVVAVPTPTQGHLTPLMRFCKLLARQEGFTVTFVDFDPIRQRLQEVHNAADNHYTQQQSPVAATSTSPHPLVRRTHIPIPGLDLSKGFNLSFSEFNNTLLSIAPYLEELILSLNRDGPPVTLLLSDFSITFPTQDVADKLGIPRIVLFTCCASRLLFTHYLSEGELISIDGVMDALAKPQESGKVFCELPGLPTLLNRDIPRFKHLTDETLSVWTNTMKGWQVCNSRAHAVVVNSFEELEASTFTTLAKCCDVPIYDVGLWVDPLDEGSATSLWKEDNTCMAWLDGQPPSSVLYISFGSITLLSQTQFEEVLHGLLSSQQRFLWVVRPGLVDNIDHSLVLASIVSKSHGKGLAINWAPQLQVLSHASVAGFLTHCGWNSISEAIAHGIPMLCWPYFADQFLNARCIVDEWKVGLMFECTEEDTCLIVRGEFEKTIRALMEGYEGQVVRHNVTKLKEKSHQCLSTKNGSSYLSLQTFIESVIHVDD